MIEELRSIEKNVTCELIELPKTKREIDVKYIFKVKLNPNVIASKHKTRLVARHFFKGIDLIIMKYLILWLDMKQLCWWWL